jgi:hypothetical protein
MMQKILNKHQAMDCYHSGIFGNHLRSWIGLVPFTQEGVWAMHDRPKRFVMRVVGVGAGPTFSNINTADEMLTAYNHCKQLRYQDNQIWLGEQAPDERIIIQGHLYNGICDDIFHLFEYTTRPMNLSISHRKGFKTMHGLQTHLVLKEVMSIESWYDFNERLTWYPNHVFEFTVFDCFLGNLPHRNVILWEVRCY